MSRSWYACTATGDPDAFTLAVLEAVRPYALAAEARIDEDFEHAPSDAQDAYTVLTEPHSAWQRATSRAREMTGRPATARVKAADEDGWARLLVCARWAHSVDVLEGGQATVARVTEQGHLAVAHLPDDAAVALRGALRGLGDMRPLAENTTWWTFSSRDRP